MARSHFQEELAKLEVQALGGLDLVVGALDRAIETVQHQDVELAAMVISDDDRIDGRYLEVQQGILSLLALQAPVAGDLRIVAALLHVMKNIERMGDQCVNVCKVIPMTGHEPPADEAMVKLMTALQRRYDCVIVDSPPLGAGVDPFVLSTLTKNVLLVLRAGETDREFALAKLRPQPVLGPSG